MSDKETYNLMETNTIPICIVEDITNFAIGYYQQILLRSNSPDLDFDCFGLILKKINPEDKEYYARGL